MSILGVNGALAGAYQYASRTQKTSANKASFTEQLQKTGEAAETSKVDAYTEYLRSKYGNVRIRSIGKDQKSLDRAGKSMSGSDVVIAPNILEQMANDPEKAAYYEGKIDDFFNATPMLTASFAAKGLVYEPGGVVVHEDGSVTYIGGCSDSPERVREVNENNKAKREKEAAQRKESMERSQEAAEERKEQIEIAYKKQSIAEALANHTMDTSRYIYDCTRSYGFCNHSLYTEHYGGGGYFEVRKIMPGLTTRGHGRLRMTEGPPQRIRGMKLF